MACRILGVIPQRRRYEDASLTSMRREACEQKQPGRGDTRCDRRREGLREESFVPCRAESGRKDLSWDSQPTFSSELGRGQKASGFCPTPSRSGAQELQA